MNLVMAYYTSRYKHGHGFDSAVLVDLDTDKLIHIRREDDFRRYKGYINLPDSRIRINNFTEFSDFLVRNCKSFDDLLGEDVKELILAEYTNGFKALDLENGDVHLYNKNSMHLWRAYTDNFKPKQADDREAFFKEVLGCDSRIWRNSRVVCRLKGELDVVRSRLDTPWLEIYNCGSGVILLDKFQSMDRADLVIFPSELKYLVGFGPRKHGVIVRCGTLMFTTNTKYIRIYSVITSIRFKKLLVSKKCGGLRDYDYKYIEYID